MCFPLQTGLPVKWVFLGSGAEFHVLSLEPGAVAPEDLWQAPPSAFREGSSSRKALGYASGVNALGWSRGGGAHTSFEKWLLPMVLPRPGHLLPLESS